MSISSISSSPILQWLQNSLSAAGLSGNSQPAGADCGSVSDGASISLFQQALQVITNQTTQPTDAPQSLNVNGTQGHHHHHHSEEQSNDPGNGSFINQLAQSILSDLQQTDEPGASSTTGSSSAPNGGSVSFIDGLAGAIANNLIAKYQQTTDSSPTPSSTSSPSQVSAVA